MQPSFFLTIGARIGVLLRIIESPGIPNPTEASGVSNDTAQSTVKLGNKERFDKEQIGIKEPFPVTNLPFTS